MRRLKHEPGSLPIGCVRWKPAAVPMSWRLHPLTIRWYDLWSRLPISLLFGVETESTVIAGYHWFSDWGRDTMIALPGLALATGRFDAARGILLAFAASVDRGMLPNRFPDAGETPEYNTVDATLWFFEAVRAFAAHTEDYEFHPHETVPGAGRHHLVA